ncbi:hypothetical protein GWK90_06370 [Candidatus Hamiltonella defensa]|uniref:Acid-shock protein n=1 Tax=Candidatus Williamhamiltonella defendens TaxID=138072 RepID=A0AAC9YF22_9ENTR|nr:hypothetical protein [Candidatus Hamiltonella defensa]ASV32892.1 hypothetical protein CJJ18_00675 [Candidatus Hamiltonella defensa]AWK15847.1 hypothetical protein CCS40_00675 [Candidatus Hamiltonella defensa]MBK4361873.1 hypothetical protein [Candidatus Hamiltonella defensa]
MKKTLAFIIAVTISSTAIAAEGSMLKQPNPTEVTSKVASSAVTSSTADSADNMKKTKIEKKYHKKTEKKRLEKDSKNKPDANMKNMEKDNDDNIKKESNFNMK